MNTQQKQVMHELIFRTAYPDHYKQMKDRQEAIAKWTCAWNANLLDVLKKSKKIPKDIINL